MLKFYGVFLWEPGLVFLPKFSALTGSKLWKQILQKCYGKFHHRCLTVPQNGTKYSRMEQVKFVEDNLQKIWSDMICLSRPCHFKFFKGCLPQISLGPFLNTLSQIQLWDISKNSDFKKKSFFRGFFPRVY